MPLLPYNTTRYLTSLARNSRNLPLLANRELPPYFSHDAPHHYPGGNSKGKRPLRDGVEEEVDDREWELRVGSGLLHLRATLPYIFNPPEDASLFPPSVYSNQVCLRLPAPLPVKLSSLHLYQFMFAMARHGMHVIHTDLYATLDKMTVSRNPSTPMPSPKDLVRRSAGSEAKRRNRQVRVQLSIYGTPRLTPSKPTSWQTSSLYTFSPVSGLIIEHEVETIRPLPGEGVAEWLSHRLWGFRANASEELNPMPAHARTSVATPLKDKLERSLMMGQQKRFIYTGTRRPVCYSPSDTQSTRTTVRELSSTCLLQELLRNDELDRHSAADELRWISQAVSEKNLASDTADKMLSEMVQLRASGMPLQYVLGDTEFGPLQLLCRPPTLIPRPETAFMFEKFTSLVASRGKGPEECKLLDLYTGSGPIPLLMRHTLPNNWRTFGVDLSEQAVALAKDNVDWVSRQHRTSKVGTRIWQADIMHPSFPTDTTQRLGGKCHVLTANPPYIPYDQYIDLPNGVRAYEDVNALLGDGTPSSPLDDRKGDGLTHYRRIASLLPQLMVPKEDIVGSALEDVPRIALEIGFDQGDDVQNILMAANSVVSRTECWKDQWGQDRLVVAWL